jgi:hypothetical protein
MKSNKAINKKSTTKGERLNWSLLSSVQTLKLTRDVIVGRVVGKAELKKRSNSNSLKANVLIN